MTQQSTAPPHRIVIVGGGAGGLELATRLGKKVGKKGGARITLVDRSRTHTWKPRLHAVAAGSMSIHEEQIDYLYQAFEHGFSYCRGPMTGLEREARQVVVGEVRGEDGELVLPERRLEYDTLVIAVGSTSNDFGTPGVAENMYTLDTPWEAHHFHQRLVNACYRANDFPPEGEDDLSIAIVGAGATGVELAAELHTTIQSLAAYGLSNLDPERNVRIRLIEAGPRILAGLSEELAAAVRENLKQMHVEVLTDEKVSEVSATEVHTESGRRLRMDIGVWAAGIKAPAFLHEIDGLETDKGNRLVVTPRLVASRDPDIFAMGDCAATPSRGDKPLPPLAQVAHQQAKYLAHALSARLRNEQVPPFRYKDYGSLVSLGDENTVGNLMGVVRGRGIRVEGGLAALMYRALYQSHLIAIQGFWDTSLDTLSTLLRRKTRASVKLH